MNNLHFFFFFLVDIVRAFQYEKEFLGVSFSPFLKEPTKILAIWDRLYNLPYIIYHGDFLL